jgi:capsular polysaccharide biosynthesis protein
VPVYSANTTLYVGKNIDIQGIQASDLKLGADLILDYRELAKSKLVANEVINELGLKNMSAGGLAGMVQVNQRNESRVIQISVNSTNPQMAMDLTNKVAEVFQKKVVEIMQVENVQIIDKAVMPFYPISPDNNRNIMLGIFLGFIIGAGIILLIAFLDKTVKSAEDVQRYLDLPVIGNIPVINSKKESRV